MKTTPFIKKALLALSMITSTSFSVNIAFAGIDLNYPTDEPNATGDLIPKGSTSDNTVTITKEGAAELRDVQGGSSYSGEATGNKVTISGGAIGRNVYGGYSEASGTITDNILTISGGEIKGTVYGGSSSSGVVTGNKVTISSGGIGQNVFGGSTRSGAVTGNFLTISGGEIKAAVYGGYSSNSGSVTGSTLIISGGKISTNAYGGHSGTGSVMGNTVVIAGGEVLGNLYGGSAALNSSNNTVMISRGVIGQSVYGGYSSDSGVITNNTVTILTGDISGAVYGGYSRLGAVTGNALTILAGDISGDIYGGGCDASGAVTDNTVTILGGNISGNVHGGHSGTDSAMGNTLTISSGVIAKSVYGAISALITSDNTVMISGGEIKGSVYGGNTRSGEVTGNTLTISGGVIGEDVFGGYSQASGAITGNSLTISGGKISRHVFGGSSYSGTVTGNTIAISNGEITGSVYGGFSEALGAVTGNTLTISSGEITGAVYGGRSQDGSVKNNRVTILAGEIKGAVYGGYSPRGEVTGNILKILAGNISGEVKGGYSSSKAVTDNTVTILAGEIKGAVYGGHSGSNSSEGNTVMMSGGEVLGNLNGGYAMLNASENTVVISGGEIKLSVHGGYSLNGSSMDNTVEILGGNISGNVFGGISSNGAAKGNTVTISGGNISGDVFGGYIYRKTSATNNTVILDSGTAQLSNSSIFGGYHKAEGVDVFTGNKLVLNDFQGTIKQIYNFEVINITSSGKEGDMLTLAGGTATDLSLSKVSINFTGISRSFNAGDKINLIKNDSGITMGSETLQQKGQQQVQSTAYIWDLIFDSDDTSIYATVLSEKFNNRSKALAEGRVASMAHLNQGADLIAGQGMSQAFNFDQAKGKIHLFSAMAATNSQYATGSHIDLYGYSALVGASISPAALPSLNYGVFGESGWGHYGSFSDFEDGAVRGSGSTEYYGGGLLTHYDFTESGIKGLSVEASFRAGKTELDYQSRDLPNAQYKLSTPYYGIHAGVNYTRELSSKLKAANYARFLWAHMDGDNVTIDGSEFRFRTMDSQRIQAGSRISYEIKPSITPYAGLSYQWECSGTARAVVDGVNGISAPSLRGGTGTGELGAVWKPMAHQAFWVDFSAQGHIGERQGVSGVVRLSAEF